MQSPPQAVVVQGGRHRWRVSVVAAALAAAWLLLPLPAGHKLIPRAVVQAAASEPNPGTLRLTGRTQAVQAQAILAPQIAGQNLNSLTITFLAPAGSHVKKGDLLARFDKTAQERDFLDQQAKLSDENDKVLEAQAKEIADRATDETEMTQAEDALSKAQLEMRKVEILSRIDAEKARQTLDETQATLAQLKDTFALKRKAAAAAIRIAEIERDATRRSRERAHANEALMQVLSPIDGISVLNSIWKGSNMGEAQEGDQVRPGVPFMQVVDPSAMEVQVKVNQEDVLALEAGQTAQVHLDAYPDLIFRGQLESIDPMGQPGDFSSKLRVFSAMFSIQGTDPRLMPDLSAAVEIGPRGEASGSRGPK
ncbi:MAG TPA: HlyD family efflux transporter periplasmic adaptor subunit [Bryobacteraceae bacterium]|jgi:multidrug efflux pump subunit AcrA (membrane-fusion protein)